MTPALQQLCSPAEGLALEARLFEGQDAVAGVWSAARVALVCPASLGRMPGFAAAAARSAARGWPVLTRPTGGGAVPQGPGVLNLALGFTAPPGFALADGYRLITDVIRAGLGPMGPRLGTGGVEASFCDGAWNLSLAGRKIVGTAQRWRPLGAGNGTRVLAHALILTDGDVTPGAKAVAALHRDLGLGPVRPDVHTTLEQTDSTSFADPNALAKTLAKTAHIALQKMKTNPNKAAA